MALAALVPLALQLAGLVGPDLVRWVAGDTAGKVAGEVVAIAKQATGTASGEDALEALRADPQTVLAFREAVLAHEARLEGLYLADRADARARDVELARLGRRNRRADVMVCMDVIGLVACVGAMVYVKVRLPEASSDILPLLGAIAAYFGLSLRDAHAFEFGSSRGSKDKDALISLRGRDG